MYGFKYVSTRSIYVVPDIMIESVDKRYNLGDKVRTRSPSKKEVTKFLSYYIDQTIQEVTANIEMWKEIRSDMTELQKGNEYIICDIDYDYFDIYPNEAKIRRMPAYSCVDANGTKLNSNIPIATHFPLVYFEKDFTVPKVQSQNLSECPICGGPGDDLIFQFYCLNNECQNFRK